MIDRIDHVGIAVEDADAVASFFEQVFGIIRTNDLRIDGPAVREVALPLGENGIVLLQPLDATGALAAFVQSNAERFHHLCFHTDDLEAELDRLCAEGFSVVDGPRESVAGEIAFLDSSAVHGVPVAISSGVSGASASSAQGIDHLAAMVADYAAARGTWERLAGLTVVNEIQAPDRLIAQLPCGQTMLELLAATTPDSAVNERIKSVGEGMIPMVAVEARDIDGEIGRIRRLGVNLPDAAPGLLPDSVTSTISPDDAFGVRIQLIQFGRSS